MQTQVIILAAGHGKRMQSELPKALTRFLGKTFIERVLASVAESGICDNPIIIIGKKKEMIRDFLGNGYTYAIQEEQLGTGHAVSMAKPCVKDAGSILVLNSDTPLISANTIRELAEERERTGVVIAMATTIIPDFLDWKAHFKSFGRIVRDDKNEILKIIEAKDASNEEIEIKELNPAYMCFEAEWLWNHLSELKNENSQGEYYLTDLIGMAFKENRKIASIAIEAKEAIGVNSKEDLEKLENLVLKN